MAVRCSVRWPPPSTARLSAACSRTRHDGSRSSGWSSAAPAGSGRRPTRSANWMRTNSSGSRRPAATVPAGVWRAKARRSVQASCQRTVGSGSRPSAAASPAAIAPASGSSRQPERAVAARAFTFLSGSCRSMVSRAFAAARAPASLATCWRQAASAAATRTAACRSRRARTTTRVWFAPWRPRDRIRTLRGRAAKRPAPRSRSLRVRPHACLPSSRARVPPAPPAFRPWTARQRQARRKKVRVLSSSTNRRYPGCSPDAADTGDRTMPATATTAVATRSARIVR